MAMNNARAVIGLHSAREVLKVRPRAVKEIWLKKGAEHENDLRIFLDFSKQFHCPLRLQHETASEQAFVGHDCQGHKPKNLYV